VKLLTCPLNGPRNISEFSYGGDVEEMPDPQTASTDQWVDYVFMHENPAGVVREWWCHTATAYWFIAERNTVTDEIIRTYPAMELFANRIEFDAGAGS
jgi:sarcosine oxidase subunit delta